MHEDVDDVIAMRTLAPEGLKPMVSISFVVHIAVILAMIALPRDWFRMADQPDVMTISLSGSPGERSTGMTSVGGRQVEQVAPPPKRPELAKPVEPTRPDTMKIPTKAPAKPETKRPADIAPPTRPPVTGAEVAKGSAAVETGSKGQSPGLTFGGGAGGAVGQLEVAAFCCPEFLDAMLRQIRGQWRTAQPNRGVTIMRFGILRDGTIVDVEVFQSSGYPLLDIASRSAIPPKLRLGLPAAYPENKLVVRLTFPYERQ